MYRQATQGTGWLFWVGSTDAGWSSGFGGFSALGPADPYFYFLPFSMKIIFKGMSSKAAWMSMEGAK